RSEFVTEWLQKRLRPLILRTLADLAGQPLDVRFEPLRAADEDAQPLREAEDSTPSVGRPRLRNRYTFASFVVGPANRLAFAAAKGAADAPGRMDQPLCLYGGARPGQAHVLPALGHAAP